jgi:hypothetical protein
VFSHCWEPLTQWCSITPQRTCIFDYTNVKISKLRNYALTQCSTEWKLSFQPTFIIILNGYNDTFKFQDYCITCWKCPSLDCIYAANHCNIAYFHCICPNWYQQQLYLWLLVLMPYFWFTTEHSRLHATPHKEISWVQGMWPGGPSYQSALPICLPSLAKYEVLLPC